MIRHDKAPRDLTIDRENIMVRVKASSREDIIRQLGALLHATGYVKETQTVPESVVRSPKH